MYSISIFYNGKDRHFHYYFKPERNYDAFYFTTSDPEIRKVAGEWFIVRRPIAPYNLVTQWSHDVKDFELKTEFNTAVFAANHSISVDELEPVVRDILWSV